MDTVLADMPEYRPFIRSAGLLASKKSLRMGPHTPQISYLLHFLDGGSIDIELPDNERVSIEGRGAWILPPGTSYEIKGFSQGDLSYVHFTVDQNPLWRRVHPHFCFGLHSSDDRAMLQPPPKAVWGIRLPADLPLACQDRIAVQLPGIVEDWLSDDRVRVWRGQGRFAAMVMNVMSDLILHQLGNTSLTVESRIARAESAAAQSLHLGFDVNQMARVAGYERSYFSVLYRRTRNESAQDFLTYLRLREAKRLLRGTDLKIAEVARQVGYGEPIVFTRMFKRHTGSNPTRWRKRT